MKFARLLCSLALLSVVVAPRVAHAEPLTKVYLNGKLEPVYFNDGDSFRIMAGDYKGAQCRLSGYNTLESFGGVHSWGDWKPKELYANAKQATYNARQGVWHCESDLKRDGYGRMLWFCRDLATDQIRKGLAHAYSVDQNPADPELLKVQHEAQENHVGMWAHGVPEGVVTSIHSKSEGGGGKDGKTYNRVVSTKDGRSWQWEHNNEYKECDRVCHMTVPEAERAAALAELRDDESTKDAVKGKSDWDVNHMFDQALQAPDEGKDPVTVFVRERLKAGKLTRKEDGCMVYVDFRRRYGGERAACLR